VIREKVMKKVEATIRCHAEVLRGLGCKIALEQRYLAARRPIAHGVLQDL
jgi:hypothetical protein